MNRTNIEYLDFTWNPLAMRCTPISEGCANCWHIKMADRVAKIPGMMFNEEMSYRGINKPYLVKERLEDPLKRKKPSIIGVQFMGDLFHEDIPDHQINSVFLTMVKADWHTYLILTKRPERMADFITIGNGWRGMMPYVWLGVTAENQQTLNDRWLIIQEIPASVIWVSMEPLLGPIKFIWNARKPNWVIAGCESGAGRRPAKIEWFRDLKNQCVEAGVPFFLKQIYRQGYFVKLPILDGQQWTERP